MPKAFLLTLRTGAACLLLNSFILILFEILFTVLGSEPLSTNCDGDISLSINGGSESFVVPGGTTVRLDVKMTVLAISVGDTKTFSLVAGLTNVPKSQYPSDSWSGATVS